MTDILKRNLAPITEAAWKAIDEQAARTLKGNLSARGLVDFSGPHGWKLGAVDLGRLEIPKEHKSGGVYWGKRSVLPLVEVRVPFHLDLMELDSVGRGSADPDLDPLIAAAQKAARFEEAAVYNGFAEGGIQGLIEATPHKAVALARSADGQVQAVVDALGLLYAANIDGPYALVLGTAAYQAMQAAAQEGYPLQKRFEKLLGGKVLWSPALAGGVLLSARGGDFEMTVGADLSVGYSEHDRDKVELFLTESFAFRVLEPKAAVALKPAAK
jgi:uncharacterized linocin/CFP29 family protein